MRQRLPNYLFLLCLCPAFGASALDATDRRYMERLSKGGAETLREVAESLFLAGSTDTEVLDVAAEVLLQKYPRAALDRNAADAMAWLCRVLGGSGNGRYQAAVDEVAKNGGDRRLRGHCAKAAKTLPKNAAERYHAGTVDLEKLRHPPAPEVTDIQRVAATATGENPELATASATGKIVDFSLIREGMSSAEVIDILGPPTGQTQRMTGKQFQPFNFGARDLQRMTFAYQGSGRIEFSLRSAYQGVFRVIAINVDASESGYP
ncbi:MAG: hypothetical protein COS34_00400 [Lysobacterales bacterium CG02_land_8_20_14_3_00_62_12]|nr:MAG: hypothetical protein COS34_00400 [Xanthomonadales bacterium CG02_land_8_20_14_3_00_62_12]